MMLAITLTESSMAGIATAGFAFLTVATTSIVGYLTYKLKVKSEETAKRLEKIEDTTEKTLVHVNHAYLVQLRLVAEYSRIIANSEKATDADRERANEAERVYNENRLRQEQSKADEMHKQKRDC